MAKTDKWPQDILNFCEEKIKRWEELLASNEFPYTTELYVNQLGPAYIDAYKQVASFIKGGDK